VAWTCSSNKCAQGECVSHGAGRVACQELSHTEALGISETTLADFEYLHAVENNTRIADVVFVHRMGGSATGTWDYQGRERLYTDCHGSAITGPRVSITRSAYAHEGSYPARDGQACWLKRPLLTLTMRRNSHTIRLYELLIWRLIASSRGRYSVISD
jgi:hypothetical protein